MSQSRGSLGGAQRYRLDSRIATGGMGEVWRGTDTVLDRAVAIKVLKPEFADDPTFRSRFETEARHSASLHHPGVAAVFDFGEGPLGDDGSPRPYLVMELVDGQPLSNLLRPGAPMDPNAAREVVARTADALAVAHAAGIVHRDVKPANILVLPDRRVKITDFGIARAADGLALTATGQVMGTPQYLSPEQASGESATPASDIYSLGVVLFECLTGRRPYAGGSPIATALAHLREPVPDLPPTVPADLAAVTRRAMAKKPADRFPTAAAFAAALRDPAEAAAAPVTDPRSTAVLTGLAPVAAAAGAGAGAGAGAAAGTALAETEETPGDRRRPGGLGWWPWLLLGLLVLAVLILLAVQLATGGDSTDNQTAPSATAEETSAEEPTDSAEPPASSEPPAPEEETVTVAAEDYLGDPVDQAEAELEALGLKVDTEEVDNPGDQEPETVAGLAPEGELAEGDSVTLTFWSELPEEDDGGGDGGGGNDGGTDGGNGGGNSGGGSDKGDKADKGGKGGGKSGGKGGG